MKPALVDVNVLVALFDPSHLHHDEAHGWLASTFRGGDVSQKWASCGLTEAGALRVLSRLSSGLPLSQVADRLREFFARPNHVRFCSQPAILDHERFDLTKLQGHNQITDALLLATAIDNHAELLTFDQNIPWKAVRGAKPSDIRLL